jgi:hypothetical protein
MLVTQGLYGHQPIKTLKLQMWNESCEKDEAISQENGAFQTEGSRNNT